MLDLSRLFARMVALHGAIPRALWKSGRAFDPFHVFLEVTYRCNLRCDFCQYLDIIKGEARTVGPVKEFTTEEIERAIAQFPRGRLITFSGGETLVRKDFPAILARASRSHRTHVITNGALLDEELARDWVDLAPRRLWQRGLVLVGVSLEGGEERHDAIVGRKGAWRRATAGVRALAEHRRAANKRFPKLNLKLVVTKDTVGEMAGFMSLAKELGCDLVNFMAEHDLVGHSATLVSDPAQSRIDVPQRAPEGVDPEYLREQLVRCSELERELGVQIRTTPANLPIDEFVRHYSPDRALPSDEYVCEGPWSRVQVTAEGRFSPCYYLRTGDTRTQTLGEAWNGEAFRRFRRELAERKVFAGCSGCCNLKYVGPTPFGLAGVDPGA